MILIIIVFVSSLLVKYDPKLHSFLDKLYSSKETNSVVSIICSLITFYIVNMIFDSPNWFEFLSNYQLKNNAKLVKSFMQIFIFALTPALFFWQKSKWNFHGLNSVSFTGLFLYFFGAFLISILILGIISCLFKSHKIRSIFLQPKSPNFANHSLNHYEIENLLKCENKYKCNFNKNQSKYYVESSKTIDLKAPLTRELQDISFKETNNLYK